MIPTLMTLSLSAILLASCGAPKPTCDSILREARRVRLANEADMRQILKVDKASGSELAKNIQARLQGFLDSHPNETSCTGISGEDTTFSLGSKDRSDSQRAIEMSPTDLCDAIRKGDFAPGQDPTEKQDHPVKKKS